MAKQLALVIDLNRCIGCHACTVACKTENGLDDQGSGVVVHTVGGPVTDWPSGTYPHLQLSWLPVSCMHCQDAPCTKVCPTGAMTKRTEDGIVVVDQERCIGCGYCIWACPYNAIYLDKKAGVVGKCDLCVHRLEIGLDPACVEACVYGARIFGDINDPSSEIAQVIRQRHGRVLQPEQRTQPSVHYVGKGS